MVKNPPANAGDADVGLITWLGIFPGEKWQDAPVFLPGVFHGQRGLVGLVHEVTKSWTQQQLTHKLGCS